MRATIEVIVMCVVGFLFLDSISRLVFFLWRAGDYLWIWLGATVFVGAIYGFDQYAETTGLIVHHWWDS